MTQSVIMKNFCSTTVENWQNSNVFFQGKCVNHMSLLHSQAKKKFHPLGKSFYVTEAAFIPLQFSRVYKAWIIFHEFTNIVDKKC